MNISLKSLVWGLVFGLLLILSFPTLSSTTGMHPPGEPPAAPPPVAPPPEAPPPKAPLPPPKVVQPPPPPPKVPAPSDDSYYDPYESPEEEAKRLAREKAAREARQRAERIRGHKTPAPQPLQEDTDMKIGGQKLPNTIGFAGHSTVTVDQYGYPIKGKLARDSNLWVRLRDITGRLKSRFVRFAKGTEVTLGTARDGEDFVVKGTLAGEELLPIPGSGGAWFKQGTQVTLDMGTGTVTTGTLARDTELPVEGEYGKKKFPAGTQVTINPQTGGVVGSTPPPAPRQD